MKKTFKHHGQSDLYQRGWTAQAVLLKGVNQFKNENSMSCKLCGGNGGLCNCGNGRRGPVGRCQRVEGSYLALEASELEELKP